MLCNSKLTPDDVNLVKVHSQVPDHPLPHYSSFVQYKLKLKNAGTYGFDTCCSSFVTKTELACSLVMSSIKKNVLVISSFIDSPVNDKSTHFCVDTGDTAVAAIVSEVPEGFGYISSHSLSYGERHDGIIYQRRAPLMLKRLDSGPDYSQTFTTFYNAATNKEIAINAVPDLKFVVHQSLGKEGLSVSAFDFPCTHQPKAWAGEVWREAIGLPEAKFHQTFTQYPNIVTCTAPINLLESIELGRITQSDKIIFTSSGAGVNHIDIIMKIIAELVNNVLGNNNQTKILLKYEFSKN